MIENIGEALDVAPAKAAPRAGTQGSARKRAAAQAAQEPLTRETATETRMERKHEKYQRLLDFCKALPPTPTAVAHPCDESSLRGAVDAAKLGLIAPILVGPRARIEAVAKQHGIDIAGLPIVDAPHSQASADEGGRAGARGQGRGADEGQPAHRRADGRGGQARHRAAHRAPRQPLLRDGRADATRRR